MPDNPPFNVHFESRVPAGDEHERLVCKHCGFIDYINPKVIVGCVATWEDTILLCKRAIEPRDGYWTLPAGFLESRETTETGAAREAFEEARAQVDILDLLAVYNVPHISQVQLFYRARLLNPRDISPGVESRQVELVSWEKIPWSELAFSTVEWALKAHRAVRDQKTCVPFCRPPA